MKQCEPFPLRSEIVIDNYYRNIVIGISAESLERFILRYFYDFDAVIFKNLDNIGNSIYTKF